jgi:hypothetical protein
MPGGQVLEEWRNDMKEKIDAINQRPLNTTTGDDIDDAGGMTRAIRMWIKSVLGKILSLLNESATALQHALQNDDIVLKNVLPFLELPSYSFQGGIRRERGGQNATSTI